MCVAVSKIPTGCRRYPLVSGMSLPSTDSATFITPDLSRHSWRGWLYWSNCWSNYWSASRVGAVCCACHNERVSGGEVSVGRLVSPCHLGPVWVVSWPYPSPPTNSTLGSTIPPGSPGGGREEGGGHYFMFFIAGLIPGISFIFHSVSPE